MKYRVIATIATLVLVASQTFAFETDLAADELVAVETLPPFPQCSATCPTYKDHANGLKYYVEGAGDNCTVVGRPGQSVTCGTRFVERQTHYECTPICTVR